MAGTCVSTGKVTPVYQLPVENALTKRLLFIIYQQVITFVRAEYIRLQQQLEGLPPLRDKLETLRRNMIRYSVTAPPYYCLRLSLVRIADMS